MSLCAFRRNVIAALVGVFVASSFNALYAAGPLKTAAKPGYESVPLFEAMERGDVVASVHVRDSTELNIAIENRTDRDLAIVMPDVFAAVPVHAQFQPGLGQGFNQGNQATNQGVSAPGGPFAQGNQQNNGFNNPGIFNIPPGKIVKAKQPCVCLEHGKPDPNVRLEYEIRPMPEVLDDAEVAQLVQWLVQGTDQRIVQLAVWHRANGTSWEQLAALQVEKIGRPNRPQYSTAELEAAQKLLKTVTETKADSTASASSGERSAGR